MARFLLTNSPDTQREALNYIFWVIITQPLMAMFQNYLGVFNGCGKTHYSFIMETARLWAIRIPIILCFKKFTELGSNGIWYAMNISNLTILFVGAYLIIRIDFSEKIVK